MVQTASAGHQKRAGATGSSRGARVMRATRPWRTAVLGNVAGVLRHGNEQNEGGESEWSSLGLRRWPRGARGGTGADEFDEDGRRSEVEDDSDGGDAGAPAVCFSARRKRGSGRISWVLRVAVRSTVATANGVGDDELRSGACRERAEEGTGSRGREGGLDGSGRLRGVSTHG